MRWLKFLIYLTIIFSVFLSQNFQAETFPVIQSTTDWSRVGEKTKRAGLPLVVLFTSEDCHYCDSLKNEYLLPELKTGDLRKRAIFREINTQSGGKMTDFDGERIRRRQFIRRYDVFATPTLVFLDHHGKEMTTSIVGYNFQSYQDLLDKALEESEGTLRQDRLIARNTAHLRF